MGIFFCDGCVDAVFAGVWVVLFGEEKFAFFGGNRSIGLLIEWQ